MSTENQKEIWVSEKLFEVGKLLKIRKNTKIFSF